MAKITSISLGLKSENPAILENYNKKIWKSDNEKVPFVTALGSVQNSTSGDRIYKWLTDTIGTINGDTAAVPGSTANITASDVVTEYQNAMQIFEESFVVDRVTDKTAPIGGAGSFAYTMDRRLLRQKLNIEQRALSGKGSTLPADGTAGLMAGIGSIIQGGNALHSSGASGSGNRNGSTPAFGGGTFKNVVVGTGTGLRELTEDLLGEALRKVFEGNGTSSTLNIFASAGNTEKIAKFKGSEQNRVQITKGNVSTYIDSYTDAFGNNVLIKPCAYADDDAVYIVDTNEAGLVAKRQFEDLKDSDNIDDGIKGSVRTEITMFAGNSKSHAKIADLKL